MTGRAAGRVPAPDHQPGPARLARVPERSPEPPPVPAAQGDPHLRQPADRRRRSPAPAAYAGPVFTIPDGARPGRRRRAMADAPARDIDVLVAANKRPELGRAWPRGCGARAATVELRRHADPALGSASRLMSRARVSVLVPNPKEGFYLPALEAMAVGHGRRVPGLHREPLLLPARARTASARRTTRTRSWPRPRRRCGRSPALDELRERARATARASRHRRRARRLPGHPRPASRSSGRQHRSMDTLVVSGAIANKPLNGGEAWVRLSWVLGLRRLGCDVWFVEQIDEAIVRRRRRRAGAFAESENRRYFDQVVERFGLDGRASLLYEGGRESARRAAGGAAPGRAGGRPAGEHQRPPRPRAADEPAAAQGIRGPRSRVHPVLARRRHGRRAARWDTTCTSRSGRTSAARTATIPTCGLEWKAVRAPGGARGLAGRRRRRPGSLHDDRRMARARSARSTSAGTPTR